MTSNLASEVIADQAVHLREEAERVLEQKHDKSSNIEEDPERIEISRTFKDDVVCMNFVKHIF